MKEETYVLKWIFILFIGIGVTLAFINFLAFRSLWLDEAMLSLNIIERPLDELFKPLDYNQVAPIGFLILEKLFSSLFDNTDWSLRLFPMVSFISSVALFYCLSVKIVKHQFFALFSTGLYSLSYYIIAYSSGVKQYSTDVAICIIILWATINFTEKNNKRSFFLCTIVWAVSVWFSNVSVIVLTSASLYLVYSIYKDAFKRYLETSIVILSWLSSFAVYYIIFIHDHPAKEFMEVYWRDASGFLPQNVFSLTFIKDLIIKVNSLFFLVAPGYIRFLFMVLFIGGLYYLFIRKKDLFLFLFTPIIIHFFLSYFQIYPFDTRLILYLTPLIILISLYGILLLFTYIEPKGQPIFKYLLIFPLFAIFISNYQKFPLYIEETKTPIEYIDAEWQNGESVYVYYAAIPAFEFYRKKSRNLLKMNSDNIVMATARRTSSKRFEAEIKDIKDPVWILFSHVYLNEEDYILSLFSKKDYEIIQKGSYHGASLYKAIPIGKSKE